MRNDTIPAITILPLRAFLGITFLYAGIQKILDPGFLQPGSATYLGKQILGFSHGSPIRFLLMQFMEYALAIGWLTIALELTVGVLVLLGLFTRLAALGGLTLSTGFFLSASWNTYPYFLGSDIVFMMCWLTLILTGSAVFALDTVVQPRLRLPISDRLHDLLVGPFPLPSQPPARYGSVPKVPSGTDRLRVSRQESLLVGAGTVLLVALGLLPRRGSGNTASQLAGAPKNPAGGGGGPTTTGSGATIPSGAHHIGNISQIPVNQAGTLTDPKTGDPAIIVRLGQHDLVAYDAVCTHAGCTVEYDPQQKLLSCPCHGATYDPAHDAQVTGGPAPSPLTKLEMSVDAQGNIYLV